MKGKEIMARPYPSRDALGAAAVALCREHVDCQERILRGLDLATAGGVADLAAAPTGRALVTQVSGHLVTHVPDAPYLGGYQCSCPDWHYGATTRVQEAGAAYDEHHRWCKHLWALRIVAEARHWERPRRALRVVRVPRPVTFVGVDLETLEQVA